MRESRRKRPEFTGDAPGRGGDPMHEIYRLVFENAHEAVFISDPETMRFVEVNRRAAESLGYTREELLALTLNDIDGSRAGESEEKKIRGLERQESISFEHFHLRKDGSSFPVEVHAHLFPCRGKKIIMFLVRDISARLAMEKSLHRSEAEKSLILNSTTDLIVYYDTDLKIQWINREMEIFSGRNHEDLIGQQCWVAWNQSPDQCRLCPMRLTRDTRKAHQGNVVSPDGRQWEIRGYPVLEDGELVGLVEFRLDVTEQKRMEAELRKTSQWASLGLIASGVAHEINNPLATISGCAEDLIARLPEFKDSWPGAGESGVTELYRRQLSTILGEVRKSSGIIYELLDFAQTKPYTMTGVDLVDLSESTVHLLDAQDRFSRYRFFVEYEDGIPPVMGNMDRLRQVMVILLTNAAEAMPEGGDIRITCTGKGNDKEVCLTVADSGPGMEDEAFDSSVEPFFAIKTQRNCPGIDLSRAEVIVFRHGGRIVVESKPDKGVSFSVFLPISEDPRLPVQQHLMGGRGNRE